MPPRAAAADAARPAAVRFAQTFRLLAPKGVHHGHHHQAEGAEALAAGDELHGQHRPEDAGVVGVLVAQGADRRGEDVADEQYEHDLAGLHGAAGHERAGGGQAGGELGGHLEGEDGQGLGREPGEPADVVGHEPLGRGEKAGLGEHVEEDVDRYGNLDDFANAPFEPLGGVVQGRAQRVLRRSRQIDVRGCPLGRRQQHPAEQGDKEGAQHGRAHGQAQVDKGRPLDERKGDEKGGGQVEKIGGQAVEQVGEDQFAAAQPSLVIALCEHGIGRHAGEEAQGEGGAGDRRKVAEAGQRPGDHGQFSRPVERLDEQGDQQAERQKDEQPQQRPAEVQPEMGERVRREHAMGSGDARTKRACSRLTASPCKYWCRDQDLNQGHTDFQSVALPTELSRP